MRFMSMLEAVQEMDCDIDNVVEALESGAIHLSGNFRGDEDEIARYFRHDPEDVPVFDASIWAQFGG